jgi:prefoldin subunit 5
LSLGELIAAVSFFIGIITFLFKNYYSFQSNTEAIKSLNKTIEKMNDLIEQLSEDQHVTDTRITSLEQQTKSLWRGHGDLSERIRTIEKGL